MVVLPSPPGPVRRSSFSTDSPVVRIFRLPYSVAAPRHTEPAHHRITPNRSTNRTTCYSQPVNARRPSVFLRNCLEPRFDLQRPDADDKYDPPLSRHHPDTAVILRPSAVSEPRHLRNTARISLARHLAVDVGTASSYGSPTDGAVCQGGRSPWTPPWTLVPMAAPFVPFPACDLLPGKASAPVRHVPEPATPIATRT